MKKPSFGLRLLNSYVKWSLKRYTHSIEIVNPPPSHEDRSVIYASTHQNTLLDPLLIIPYLPNIPYSLTRGDVFKSGWIQKAFFSMRMRPVFRIRDGFSAVRNLGLNAFSNLTPHLLENEDVLFFAEANNDIQPELRPIKKGVVRIAENCPQERPPIVYALRISWSHPVYSFPKARLEFSAPIVYQSFEELPENIYNNLDKMSFLPFDSQRDSSRSWVENLTLRLGMKREFTGLIRWCLWFVALPSLLILSLLISGFITILTVIFI